MKTLAFSRRCAKEILRDPINLAFGLGFPVVLLLLLSAIQANIPVTLFEINRLTPGITIFGLSFFSLFSATLIAKDRESAFLSRLYTTPMKSRDFILGYMLPLIPMAFAQAVICYLFALPLGLTLSPNVLFAVIGILPMAVFNIALGLLFGSLLHVKQVGGICGALLTNLTAWFSGIWFDLNLVGDIFQRIAHVLPFAHAVKMEQALLEGSISTACIHLLPVLIYSTLTTASAAFCFLKQMKRQ